MTREEAINRIKDHMVVHHIGEYPHIKLKEALDMALTALRPVSREQVEKVWRGEWETVADEGFVDTMGRQVFHLHCPVCDFFWRETGHKKYFRFCPHCGAPMTDEAVDIVMRRLEALKDGL